MKVARLTDRHAPGLEELLLEDPLVNLFLLGYMDAVPMHRAYWYGVLEGDVVRSVVLLVPGRLMVPWIPHDEDAEQLGSTLKRRHRPCMVVGPRRASDLVWSVWGEPALVDRWHDQQLYICDHAVPGATVQGFRQAIPDEWETVARNAAEMEIEDIGRRAYEDDPVGFLSVVKRRIELGQTWVLERGGRIVFQINVGTVTSWGAQVGGTFVPRRNRGQGLAREGMRALSRVLLPLHRVVTLHVNEANTPAVRSYEATGYVPHAPYRLITVRGDR